LEFGNLISFSKAFDTVRHVTCGMPTLFGKLAQLDISDHIYDWLLLSSDTAYTAQGCFMIKSSQGLPVNSSHGQLVTA